MRGKVALVTGATRGIGKAIAEALIERGATVIGTGTGKATAAAKLRFIFWPLDLADEQSKKAFFERMRNLKQLDILVNNAGINVIAPIDRIDQGDWDKVVQVNLTGAMLLMKTAAALMKKNKTGGRILNVSSIFGIIAREKRNAYAATKAGLIGLTRASALDLAPHKILVNAICPGFVLTDLTKSILSVKERKALLERIPMGRFGLEEEIARTAAFLCSLENTYLTGQAIVIDGGYSIQ